MTEDETQPSAERTNKARNNQNPSRWSRFKEYVKNSSSLTDWCIAAFTFFLAASAIYQFIIMGRQLDVMRKEFVATQRAAVYLGLPDGKVMDFIVVGGKNYIVAYGRNYGASTARDVVIEIFPLQDQDIPPFRGFNAARTGPSIPPGFPYTKYEPLDQPSPEDVRAAKSNLHIVGRISYSDQFGDYCETFEVIYRTTPEGRFDLSAAHENLCDGRSHHIVDLGLNIGTKGSLATSAETKEQEK